MGLEEMLKNTKDEFDITQTDITLKIRKEEDRVALIAYAVLTMEDRYVRDSMIQDLVKLSESRSEFRNAALLQKELGETDAYKNNTRKEITKLMEKSFYGVAYDLAEEIEDFDLAKTVAIRSQDNELIGEYYKNHGQLEKAVEYFMMYYDEGYHCSLKAAADCAEQFYGKGSEEHKRICQIGFNEMCRRLVEEDYQAKGYNWGDQSLARDIQGWAGKMGDDELHDEIGFLFDIHGCSTLRFKIACENVQEIVNMDETTEKHEKEEKDTWAEYGHIIKLIRDCAKIPYEKG